MWHGLPGHPLHPPLTDVTIGAYAFAVVAGILSKLGVVEHAFAQAWWLALVVAAVSSVLTVLTGLADWLTIEWGSELWTTATLHAVAMAIATVFFLLAILFGHAGYTHGSVNTGSFVLTLIGLAAFSAGGWLAARSRTYTGCACSASASRQVALLERGGLVFRDARRRDP